MPVKSVYQSEFKTIKKATPLSFLRINHGKSEFAAEKKMAMDRCDCSNFVKDMTLPTFNTDSVFYIRHILKVISVEQSNVSFKAKMMHWICIFKLINSCTYFFIFQNVLITLNLKKNDFLDFASLLDQCNDLLNFSIIFRP